MADNTCMQELEATIQDINATLKKFMEVEEVRHTEYMRSRSTNVLRMDRIEAKLVALQNGGSASNGDSNSLMQSTQQFQPLTGLINLLQENIYVPESLNDELPTLDQGFSATEHIAATLSTTDDKPILEALNEDFPVLDASNLCSGIEPLIADFDMNIMLNGPISSVMEHNCCSEKEAIKRHGSSVLSNTKVCNLIVAHRQLDILLSNPPDLVPDPPPPLAPPWLHHSVYGGAVDLPPLTIENNTRLSSQLDQEVLLRNPSQFDNPISLQVINTMMENSIRDFRVITHVLSLPLSASHIVIPFISVGGFFDFGTTISDDHTSSYQTYHLFVESSLSINFSWNIALFQHMKAISTRLQIKLSLDSVLFSSVSFEGLLLGIPNLELLVQNYSEISLKCKEFSCGFFITSALELSIVALGLNKLVNNGNFSLFSLLVITPFGYIAFQYGYMSTCYSCGVAVIELLIGKQQREINMSLVISCCKSVMQYQQELLSDCVLPCVSLWDCLLKTQQMAVIKKSVHEYLTLLAFIVGHITRLEYSVSHTYFVNCVSFIGLVYASCWRLIQLEIFVDIMMVWKILCTNKVQLSALVETFLYIRYRHVTYKPLLPVGDYAAQSIARLCNGSTLALNWLEGILQTLQQLEPKPYHVHSLIYMHDLYFYAAICVVATTTKGLLLAMRLSPVFYMKKIKRDKTLVAKTFTCGKIKEFNNSTILYSFSFDLFDSAIVNIFESLIHHIGCEVFKIKCGPFAIMGSPTLTELLAFRMSIGGNFCIFIGKCLVLILQLCTIISKVNNDHEPFSNVVLKIYVQESLHIYFENFESNSLDVVILLSGCFVRKKGSSQFNQWDPGGCSLVHRKGSIDLEATWVGTTIPQHIALA